MPFEYGACPCGGGDYEARLVEVRMRAGGSKPGDQGIVLTDVPQGVCLVCGSRVYKAEVLARIEAVMMGEATDPVLASGASRSRESRESDSGDGLDVRVPGKLAMRDH